MPGITGTVDNLKKINIETVSLEKGKIIVSLSAKPGGECNVQTEIQTI